MNVEMPRFLIWNCSVHCVSIINDVVSKFENDVKIRIVPNDLSTEEAERECRADSGMVIEFNSCECKVVEMV